MSLLKVSLLKVSKRAVSKKRLILAVGSVVVSVGLVALLLSRIDLQEAQLLVAGADRRWLVLAALLTLSMPFSAVLRWRGVLRALGNLRVPYLTSLRAVLMANVLNSFLPSKLGDAAKAGYLRKQGGFTQGIGTVLLERFVDLGVLGLLALLGSLHSGVLWGSLAGAGLLGGVAVVFAVVLFTPFEKLPLPGKVVSILSSFKEVFVEWLKNTTAIAQTLVGSLLTWAAGGFTVYCLGQAFGAPFGVTVAYSVFPPAILAGLLPLTISGIGTRDAAFVALLGSHASTEQATLIGLGYTLYAYWLLSLISLPVVFWEVVAFWRGRADTQVQDPAVIAARLTRK